MIIVAGGDSFIYGTELDDCTNTFSNKTFFAQLKENNEYNCVAWPGIGNDAIARRIINACETFNSPMCVLICWTFASRFEFRFINNTGQKTEHWYAITPWSVESNLDAVKKELHCQDEKTIGDHIKQLDRIKKNGIYEFAKTYYQYVASSEYWEIYTTLKEIVYLQNYLKSKNIPYLFTCADNNILYNHTVRSGDWSIQSLYKQILQDQRNWFWFPPGTTQHETTEPRGFYQWALENKYSVGITHPLEDAHSAAAKLIKAKFNEMVNKYI